MGQQLLIFMVISMLVGGLGGNALSKLNPFNKSNKVAIAKQESNRTESFRDKAKGIEWKMTERSKGQTPVIKKESFVDKWLWTLVKIGAIVTIASLFLGTNLWKYIRKLKKLSFQSMKALRQTVAGIQEVKGTMNGEEEKLRASLKDKHDEDTELLIKKIKLGNSDEKII